MAVVNTKCEQGHPMVGKPLRAVRQCKGCGEPCSTVYDCEYGCYGKCCECWVEEVLEAGDPLMALGGGGE